jgi:hypothetical protein
VEAVEAVASRCGAVEEEVLGSLTGSSGWLGGKEEGPLEGCCERSGIDEVEADEAVAPTVSCGWLAGACERSGADEVEAAVAGGTEVDPVDCCGGGGGCVFLTGAVLVSEGGA